MKRIFFILPLLSLIFTPLSAALVTSQHTEQRSTPWGRDADLVEAAERPSPPSSHLGQKICSRMISFYQNYISIIDGPRSSFYPSSSQYTKEAISKYGVLPGIALGCDRLLRENRDIWIYEKVITDEGSRKHDPIR